MSAELPLLDIRSELTVDTNGVTTTLVGGGSLLRWDLVDAERVAASLPAADRRHLAAIGRTLDRAGIRLLVSEGDRALLEIGSTRSFIGALLVGTKSVRPRALRRLATIAWRRRSITAQR